MENCKKFDDVADHHNDWTKCYTQKSKSIIFLIQGHNIKSNDENDYADQHPFIVIFIERKFVFIAHINTISYFEDCVKTGLDKRGGGTAILRVMIEFLEENKKRLEIDKIQLLDNSVKYCKHSDSIELPLMAVFTSGDTWYGKYGFLPFDRVNEKIDQSRLKQYQANKRIVNTLLFKDTNITCFIDKAIKELKMQHKFNNMKQIYLDNAATRPE